jgi:nucleotide-binding universal stress UspA family protein
MTAVSSTVIVSYDGTANDEDAVAFGRLLARGGARLSLAYVRHSREPTREREMIAQHDAESLLARGAAALEDPDVPRHVLWSASTPAALEQLATEQGASLIVFGSDYRTSPGRAEPGTSAQQLIDGGPVAIAVAAAGLRAEPEAALRTLAVAAGSENGVASETAEMLAAQLGAAIVPRSYDADLIVVGSRADGAAGRIDLSGAARATLNAVRGSVLVLPSSTVLAL